MSCMPVRRIRLGTVVGVMVALAALAAGASAEESGARPLAAWDTMKAAGGPIAPEAVAARTGWTAVPEDRTAHAFKGDAVLANDRLAVVLRRGAAGAEVYARGPKGWTLRATLAPATGAAAAAGRLETVTLAKNAADAVAAAAAGRLETVTLAKNAADAVAADVSFKAGKAAATVRFELSPGQAFVKTRNGGGARALGVAAPSRFVVLPDFFADDIVVDAADLKAAEADLPSENFLLHLVGDGDALVMTVAGSREEDARVALAGEGAGRRITQSEIHYGKDGVVWVAVLETPGVWHERTIARKDAEKVLTLDWRMPYAAQWRVDWRRTDRLTDSWEMIFEKPNKEFEKPGWFGEPARIPADRKRWTTVLGRFLYPCWVAQDGQGCLQPLAHKALAFEGPAVLYPINRVKGTPLDAFTVTDIVRATLGVGPCEYILDVEGQGQAMKGRATCGTRDALKEIYAKKQQMQKQAEIEKILQEVVVFVKHIRGRIEDYVAFGHRTLAYLEEQKKAHPEWAETLADLEAAARRIDESVAKRQEKIQTPAYVEALTKKFRQTVMKDTSDEAPAKCKEITEAIVVVGGNQDELVGECRWAVKVLRQRAALAMATDPRVGDVATEIRRRTQDILRNALSYEAPRH